MKDWIPIVCVILYACFMAWYAYWVVTAPYTPEDVGRAIDQWAKDGKPKKVGRR